MNEFLDKLQAAQESRGDSFCVVISSVDGHGRVAADWANDVIGDPIHTFETLAELDAWLDLQIVSKQ